jgi:TRAP-type C4-dicarboxylate transport system permease small subunit
MNVLIYMITGIRHVLVRLLELAAIAMMGILTIDVLWGIFSRYVLGSQTSWTEEVATILLMWVGMLGASLTYAEKGHLGVDYFVGKLDPSAQRINEIAVHFIVALFALGAMVYGGYLLFSQTMASGQTLPALRIQAGYKYIVVPVSGCFIVLFAIEHIMGLLAGKNAGGQAVEEAKP